MNAFSIQRVLMGSKEHIAPIGVAILFTIVVIFIARKWLNDKQKFLLFNTLSFFTALTLIAYHVYMISTQEYSFKEDLPLFLCSFMAFLLPIYTYFRKYWMFEILVFWVFAGTIQAVLTPDIADAYNFDYFRYWIVHLGLVIVMLYAIVVYKERPKFTSIFKSMLALQVYIFVMFILNYALDSNYSYLMHKPETASVLDYFGKWPYYIIVAELAAIPYFLLIYLPFYLVGKTERYLANT